MAREQCLRYMSGVWWHTPEEEQTAQDCALYFRLAHLRDIADVTNFEGGDTFVEGNGLPG